MERLRKLPTHKHPFSNNDLLSILGSERNWFVRATWLNQAAELEFGLMREPAERSSIEVGKPVAALIQAKDRTAQEHEILGAMLYGMAVECWLKGLIIMSLPRKSSRMFDEMSRWLSKQTLGAQGSTRDMFDTLLPFLSHQNYKQRASKYEAARVRENSARRAEVKKHTSHQLEGMARAARIATRLAKQDFAFLDWLSKANQLGRYPATNREQDLIPWAGIIGEKRRRDRISYAIFERYKVLLHQNRLRLE